MDNIQMMLQQAQQEFPIFKGITMTDRRMEGMFDDRKLEFYHPEDSPTKGFHIDVFDSSMQERDLDKAIFGELLHAAPKLSKSYAAGKKALLQTFTHAQRTDHNEAYKESGDKRPFDKWMDASRVDAFIRGYVVKQWPDYQYTPEQRKHMDKMINDLHMEGKEWVMHLMYGAENKWLKQ